jgi:NTP pyrophosphatase (non-canonical NTP hydrolase)
MSKNKGINMLTIDEKIDVINHVSNECYEAAKANGWWDNPFRNKGEILMLMVSELAEALEALRSNKPSIDDPIEVLMIEDNDEFKKAFQEKIKDTYEDELADTVIRIMDATGEAGISLGGHIMAKLRYNSLRGHKHGGKKF